MDRREMLKLSSATSLAALDTFAHAATLAKTSPAHGDVPQWEVFEVELAGPSAGNPFTEVELSATFSLGNRSVPVINPAYSPDTHADFPVHRTKSRPVIALRAKCLPDL